MRTMRCSPIWRCTSTTLGADTRQRFALAVTRRSLVAQFPAIDRLGYVTNTPAGRLQVHEFAADGSAIRGDSGFSRIPEAALERPLGYARDFNTLGLSARVSRRRHVAHGQ